MTNLGILVVEDSVTMRKVAEIVFAGTGYSHWIVPSVEEANRILREKKVDLVILDAGLQQPSVYEFIRSIRQEKREQSPKFLLWTSQYHPYQETLGVQVGVDAYIQKPFEVQGLLDKLTSLFTAAASVAHTQIGIPVAQVPVPPVVVLPKLLTPVEPEPLPELNTKELAQPTAKETLLDPSSVLSLPKATLDVPKPAGLSAPGGIPQHAPQMPRVPFLPRAPVPLSVINKLEELAKKGNDHKEVAIASHEVLERVAWEVIPALAEVILQEQVQRVLADRLRKAEGDKAPL